MRHLIAWGIVSGVVAFIATVILFPAQMMLVATTAVTLVLAGLVVRIAYLIADAILSPDCGRRRWDK